MASSAAKALRRAQANERLEAEVTAIASTLDVALPAAPRLAGDPDLAATQRVEHQADVLAAIRAALGNDTAADTDGATDAEAEPKRSRSRKKA